MIRSVAVLLFGLAVVYAQVKPSEPPSTVIVKKIYGNAPAGIARQGFVPAPSPVPVAFQQPYPYPYPYNGQYYNQNYNGQYYNQYQRAQYPYYQYQGVSPSPVPAVFASPAPPPAPISVSVTPTPAVFKSQPVPQFAGKTGVLDKDARVLSEERNVDFDGTFKYAYQTDNGIAVNAEGFVKQPTADSEGPIQVIQGSYTLYTPEGVPVQISYIADENGYRASGDAIPTPYPELAQAYANAPVEKQK